MGYDEQQAGGDELDNESLDEDMKAFIQTTLEHRKQREQKKREEQQKKKQTRRQSGGEEYCDATNLNFKATRQKSEIAAGDGTAQRSSASELLAIRARRICQARAGHVAEHSTALLTRSLNGPLIDLLGLRNH
uniref:Uncharacterized protein n=1 Tax=Globodera pallida TaxID=36090 RepID=A0A183BMN8_GLOPA